MKNLPVLNPSRTLTIVLTHKLEFKQGAKVVLGYRQYFINQPIFNTCLPGLYYYKDSFNHFKEKSSFISKTDYLIYTQVYDNN